MDRVRIATLNVWSRNGDWPSRLAALASGFARMAPDVIALQETMVDTSGDQVVEMLGDGYHVTHQAERAGDGMGVSIASRWPPRAIHEIDLYVSPGRGRSHARA